MNPNSSNKRTIAQTTEDLRAGRITPDDIEPIRVVEHEGELKTLDNRRLKAMKDAGITDAPAIKLDLNDPAVRKEFERKYTTRTNGETVIVESREQRLERLRNRNQ